MKYFITDYKNRQEKEQLNSMGLYVYDLRNYDEEWDHIFSIEENVLVNRYGSIITSKPLKLKKEYPNNFILYEDFSKENIKVKSIEELGIGIKSLNIIDFSNEEQINTLFLNLFPRSSLNNKTLRFKINKIKKYYESNNNYKLVRKREDIYQIYYKDTSTN